MLLEAGFAWAEQHALNPGVQQVVIGTT